MTEWEFLDKGQSPYFYYIVPKEDIMRPPDVDSLYFDGRHYDQRLRDFIYDISFWIRMVREYGGPVLELTCGTGRVTIPLAEEGFRVTGIDISDSMLGEAIRKSTQSSVPIEWIKADVRDFDLEKKFDLIIFPANTVCHLLALEELEACLWCVRKHLKSSGKFIIDVFNPRLDILLRDPLQRYPHSEYEDPDGKGTIVVTETNEYDSASQINQIKLFYNLPGRREEIIEELNMRIYFPKELDLLLQYNGFKIEAKFGNYDLRPFNSVAPKQLIVCGFT